jgi:sialic acid synthase SpsE
LGDSVGGGIVMPIIKHIFNSVFIIAEAGVNHNGDINLAKQLVDVAKQAGANAVKFQTFKTENIVTIDAPKAEYQKQNTNSKSQFDCVSIASEQR